jgi:hypothetical protein
LSVDIDFGFISLYPLLRQSCGGALFWLDAKGYLWSCFVSCIFAQHTCGTIANQQGLLLFNTPVESAKHMNGKQTESALYLTSLGTLETNIYTLYETFSKKINQPENSFLLSLAYDSLKCSKIIDEILSTLDLKETSNPKKDIAELTANVNHFTKTLTKINNLDYETTIDSLKQLSVLEEQLNKIYQTYAQSPQLSALSEEFSTQQINMKTFKKIFETFAEQKAAHRETLIDLIFGFESKEAQRNRTAPPLVQYRNPDSWIRDAGFHVIPNTQPQENPT